jgi:hypothetical protein
MKTKIIEVTNAPEGINWGKFMVGRFEPEEQNYHSPIEHHAFLNARWGPNHIWVLDLETGEGAFFAHGGCASYDLNSKHQVWVCPMFEPFLNWLYEQDITDLDALPAVVTLTEKQAPSSLFGYRRQGEDIER